LLEAVIPPTGGSLRIRVRESVPVEVARRIGEQLLTLLEAGRQRETRSDHEPRARRPEEHALLAEWNSTAIRFDREATVDEQFRMCAARTPDALAVSCLDATLTYSELQSAVAAFETVLRDAGATRGSLVGIALDRDVDLLVAVLAVLSLGAAYVPLDPDYPQERLAFMVADSGLGVVVANADVAARIAGPDVAVVTPQNEPAATGQVGRVVPEHSAEDLAYVIYTSGSTGRPKGVMLEHRNVLNFFAAMDEVIEHDPPGTWLAVTSLSFDISVLELLWTVTRGFHVVIQKHGITSPLSSGSAAPATTAGVRPTSLSLFFFAAGDSQATDGYRLLRQSVQFADANGFEAIWLPERHFHEFGGAYPNPSVLASAVAVLTDRIAIRAGSVVLPLHSSARVAEEWSIVDNLSGGRVGISFAPGWQPNDFVLNPTGFATAREDLQGRIDEVCALWRGDTVEMLGPDDRLVDVRTLPRPIQPELPLWLTSAGSTKTFEKAGEMGQSLLTHLLGQSVEQLADNIAVYRAAWDAAGHEGEGHVTVMLHTFLNGDRASAFELAEEPMKKYLGSAAGLLKNMASAFPIFANASASADEAFQSLTDSEMDELLTMAAARYLNTSGLFGDLDDARQMALDLSRMGVDEIACLIDFGLDTDDVLDSLPLLSELQSVLAADAQAQALVGAVTIDADTDADSNEGLADLVGRHAVTHVQCTPSLAAMLLADPRDQLALGAIRHLMVGGEALPEKLSRDLRSAVSGRLTNMYGPTETTIWSLVHEIDSSTDGPVPIGRAIGNTTVHVLDAAGQVLPIGALGELHIGGEGVARGYLGREELTAERFVERPGMGRVYATGDLARLHDGGVVEFAGRVDFQVKIRGHRIELGEIEAQLDLHPTVQRSVVVARGDAADARLVAFVVLVPDADLDEQLLRKHVGSVLPDVMVPDFVISLPFLPLTPNGKVDRAALPADVEKLVVPVPADNLIAPENDLERMVAAVWAEQLSRHVGRTENFFDIGGNSLLAVAVFRQLQEQTGLPIALTDVFRYPTVAGFAAYLRQRSGTDGGPAAANSARSEGLDRGARRRKMLEGRRG
jgi:natural product biosynthesis luciferase-like monooxygenase protein